MNAIPEDDLAQIGASPDTRRTLELLRDEGHVKELVDGYRLCIAVACAWNEVPTFDGRSNRTTMFATNTVDTTSLDLRVALTELYPEYRAIPYRVAEALAEAGALIVNERMSGTHISLSELVRQAEEIGG